MNLKQFLKPDWRKNVIFIIIFFSLIFAPILPTSAALPTPVGVKGGYVTVPGSIYSEMSYGYGTLNKRIIYIEVPIIISLIISYLLSCFFVWLYDRFKSIKIKK